MPSHLRRIKVLRRRLGRKGISKNRDSEIRDFSVFVNVEHIVVRTRVHTLA